MSKEISAGILAFRRRSRPEVLLGHPGGPFWVRRDVGVWTIPKGLANPAEDLLATAQREFAEETGFVASPPFIPLGSVKQKSGKTVHGFASAGDFDPAALAGNSFEIEWPPRSGKRRSFPELDRAAWFGLPQAREKILPYQLPFIAKLEEWLAQRTPPSS